MDEINWIHIAVALAGGGAMGAIITQLTTWYRRRVQTIGYNVKTQQTFAPITSQEAIEASVQIKDSAGRPHTFDNLYTSTLVVMNKGNVDFSEFKMGIDFPDHCQVLGCSPRSSNRYKKVDFLSQPNLTTPIHSIDLELKPFNRNNVYEIDFFITSKDNHGVEDANVSLATSHSVRFSQMTNALDVLNLVTDKFVFHVGPFKVLLFR